MGTLDMSGAKNQFLYLLGSITPTQLPNFTIWMDLKLAEYKIFGRVLTVDMGEDDQYPEWIKNSLRQNLSFLFSESRHPPPFPPRADAAAADFRLRMSGLVETRSEGGGSAQSTPTEWRVPKKRWRPVSDELASPAGPAPPSLVSPMREGLPPVPPLFVAAAAAPAPSTPQEETPQDLSGGSGAAPPPLPSSASPTTPRHMKEEPVTPLSGASAMPSPTALRKRLITSALSMPGPTEEERVRRLVPTLNLPLEKVRRQIQRPVSLPMAGLPRERPPDVTQPLVMSASAGDGQVSPFTPGGRVKDRRRSMDLENQGAGAMSSPSASSPSAPSPTTAVPPSPTAASGQQSGDGDTIHPRLRPMLRRVPGNGVKNCVVCCNRRPRHTWPSDTQCCGCQRGLHPDCTDRHSCMATVSRLLGKK